MKKAKKVLGIGLAAIGIAAVSAVICEMNAVKKMTAEKEKDTTDAENADDTSENQ